MGGNASQSMIKLFLIHRELLRRRCIRPLFAGADHDSTGYDDGGDTGMPEMQALW